jgi:hypothetical protein
MASSKSPIGLAEATASSRSALVRWLPESRHERTNWSARNASSGSRGIRPECGSTRAVPCVRTATDSTLWRLGMAVIILRKLPDSRAIQSRNYTNQAGVEVKAFEIVLDRFNPYFKFVDDKPAGRGDHANGQTNGTQAHDDGGDAPSYDHEAHDDQIPF